MKQDNHDVLQVSIKLQDALWLTIVKAKNKMDVHYTMMESGGVGCNCQDKMMNIIVKVRTFESTEIEETLYKCMKSSQEPNTTLEWNGSMLSQILPIALGRFCSCNLKKCAKSIKIIILETTILMMKICLSSWYRIIS